MHSAALLLALILLFAPIARGEDDWGSEAAPGSAAAGSAVPPDAVPAFIPPAPLPYSIMRQVQLLKLRADGFYRARRYREACNLYLAAARLDSTDAAVRNDLGLCYRNLGRKDSSLLMAREALRLSDRSLAAADTEGWSFPDLRARKTAYYTLDKLGGPMSVPKPGQCETWTSADGICRARMHVCAEQGSRAAKGGTLRWDVLRAGVARLNALFSYDEVEVPSQLARPELRDMEELSIEGVPESKLRWVNRDSAATLPLGEFLETADSACASPGCGNLERERIECRVLHFNPCAGVIGMACAYQEEDGPDRIVVGEYYLIPAR